MPHALQEICAILALISATTLAARLRPAKNRVTKPVRSR
jgi:hypothetical protein